MIPRETFRAGDRIRAYIYDVRRETRGPQIFLSRSHPQFMVRLFAQEVPEIYDGVIEIRAVARDPGSRAKIAVISKDSSIDPVGACVGMRGVRVQAVVQELQGERIDIIPWIGRSRRPSSSMRWRPPKSPRWCWTKTPTASKWWCRTSSLSLGIGRRGQNVRLASQLTGWQIDILTEAEESERRQKEFASRTQLFMESLDVDETVAQLLASEGFATIEDVAYVDVGELAQIEAFDEETAQELQSRARRIHRSPQQGNGRQAPGAGRRGRGAGSRRRHPGHGGGAGRSTASRRWKTWPAAPPTICSAITRPNKDKERVRVPGALEGFNLTADDANAIIMKARVKIGWIEEDRKSSKKKPAEEAEGEEPTEA